MAFKFVVLCAVLACANAGGLLPAPALAYSAAPALTYSAGPAISHTTYHAGPAIASYAAPTLSYNAPAITSQSSNILRSFGNLGQVSTYSKTIDTPFSSVRKADIRVSNPGLRIAAAPALAYSAAPAYAYSAAPAIHAAPAYAYSAAPAIHAAPALAYSAAPAPAIAVGHHGLGVAYSAAPAVSHINYASAYANYAW